MNVARLAYITHPPYGDSNLDSIAHHHTVENGIKEQLFKYDE